MEHEMRAEYAEAAEDAEAGSPRAGGPVKLWHMVRLDDTRSMCGRELRPDAAVQSADVWGTAAAEPFCHSCGALYLREVP
ncbi:hypothetical protein [Streptomyces paromomycinus]|uniref:Uncharacterized protein n=1 Tax=Streptomyces paromomycinus TaxID=92743 RepID=A0A401W1C5_STREY|nr:hypothetical protein [Streptomyces paromomycinus]GCD43107.1 hypothetical protein GKJPGBOP_02784 [Streptomyces paromomycinus]